MRTDRRGFLRVLGGALAWLSGARSDAAADEVFAVHRATRNTRLGAVGPRPPRPARRVPFKAYPAAEQTRLPDPATGTSPGLPLSEAVMKAALVKRFEAAPISLTQLSHALYYTNGVTGRRRSVAGTTYLRAAPSAGALYANEVYLVAERVEGLPPGLYYYGVKSHELMRLRPGSLLGEVVSALEPPETLEGTAAALLISSVFARYTWRYANRGYRYALIDCGHIGENLRLTSASLGWADALALRFEDDRLNRLLELDGRGEAVCAVHTIGPARKGEAPPSAPARALTEHGEAGPGAGTFRGSAIERYHAATKLVRTPVRARDTTPLLAPRRFTGVATPLAPPAPTKQVSVETAIAQRRSAERFEPEPVDLATLSFVTELAHGNRAMQQSAEVELLLACHRVAGLKPGFYAHAREAHRLVLRREGDFRAALTRACLGQTKAGAAAVAFFMVGRLREAVGRGGARSYRDLLLEAGAIGQRIYLAAEGAGIAARNLAAFVDDDLNPLLGLDGRREAVLHLTLLGPGH